MLGPHPTQHRVYQTRVKPNDTEGRVLRLKAFLKKQKHNAAHDATSLVFYIILPSHVYELKRRSILNPYGGYEHRVPEVHS